MATNPFAVYTQPEANPFAKFTADVNPEGIPGMRRVQPGEIPTETGYVAVPPKEPERNFIQKALGYGLDVPMTIGSRILGAPLSMLSIPVGGLTGPFRGQDFERGAESGLREVERQMYQPRTPEGQAALDIFGRVASSLPPVIGTGGVPQISVSPAARTVGGGMQAAAADLQAAARARENRATGQLVKQSYELGPKIDAAAQGRDLGLVVPPVSVAPTPGTRVGTTLAGTARVVQTANKANEPVWNAAAREDMSLPAGTKLDKTAFSKARSAPDVTGPYQEVSQLGTLTDPNLNVAVRLEKLKSSALIGDEGSAAAVNNWVNTVQDQIANGVDANLLTASIRQMRDEATRLFKSEKAGAKVTPEEMAMAQAKWGAAHALEDLLAQNITDKTLLERFQKAREKNARSYDYERATNLATGQVDPSALAALAAEGRPLSGNLAKMANFAANFPEVSQPGAGINKPGVLDVVKRGGVGGVVGSAIGGAAFGLPGYWGGGLLGTAAGGLLSDVIARQQVGPRVQSALANVMDYRIQPNQLTPATENLNRLLPAIYDWRNATAPNWTPGRGGPGPTFGPEPAPAVPLLGAATAEETMANVQRMRAQDYASAKMREEAAMRAAEQQGQTPFGQMVNQLAAGERRGTEGVPLQYSVGSGKFYPAEGTPAGPLAGVPSSLETAVQKMSGPEPQRFNMTAQEMISWNKAKAGLVELEPGFNKLSDKAIAEKMLDRKWIEDTVQKARDKAAAFEEIAARAKTEQARQEALANRERMLDTLDSLEERLRVGRPVERGGQGPKTRAAQREANPERTNMLAPEEPVANKLIVPESVGAGPRAQPGAVNVSVGPSLESRRPAAPKTEAPKPAAPALTGTAKDVAQAMSESFGYAPDLAAKYANDAAWIKQQLPEVEKMLAFEKMMEQEQKGYKPQAYTAKLPKLIEAMRARLKDLQ